MTDTHDVPPSVQLGEVVPPEDPEDWGRPLTWIVAAGMLVAPLIGAAWFLAAPPDDVIEAVAGTSALAAVLAVGSSVVGGTQRGARRALSATIGSGLFGALGLVVAGTILAEGIALPVASLAAVGGVIGAVPAGSLSALLADHPSRARRIIGPALVGAMTAIIVVRLLTTG
jgi:hypothetical protein